MVAIRLIELDPLDRQGIGRGSDVWDLARLWDALLAAESIVHKKPDTLLPLPASASRLDEKKAATEASRIGHGSFGNFGFDDFGFMEMQMRHQEQQSTPGRVIVTHSVVSQVSSLLEQILSMESMPY